MAKEKEPQKITLDNKTIAKLAIAIATAIELQKTEVIGPLARKVLEKLDALDNKVPHFANYKEGQYSD